MAEYRDLSTHKLQQLAQQRLREVPGLDPNDLGPFVVAEEMEYTHPEYYRERMVWIITAPAQELLDAMPFDTCAETLGAFEEWLARRN